VPAVLFSNAIFNTVCVCAGSIEGRRQRANWSGMAFQHTDRQAVFQIPNPQRMIGRSRDDMTPIGRYRNRGDPVLEELKV
jgi:hypothetical protein